MRPSAAPPLDDPGDPALVEQLRDEIEQHGPITFARFMQRVLYEPDLGYYATSHERPTRAGDFLTAPELHPIFGEAVATQLIEMWQRLGEPATFTVREHGAGRGALAAALPEGMPYEAIEFADPAPATPIVGCILANELLDALPVHRVVQTAAGLRELYVGWSGGRLVEAEGELSDRALESWFADAGIELAHGQRAEVNLAMVDWLAELPAQLERGYVLIFDYALPAAELYGPRRQTGTLRAFRAHHVSSNLLGGVGRQDLTSHVDLDALESGARAAGLDVLGRTTQARFLLGNDLDGLYEAARTQRPDDWDDQLRLRSAVRRLLDPRHFGGYAAVVLGKEAPAAPLRGLAVDEIR